MVLYGTELESPFGELGRLKNVVKTSINLLLLIYYLFLKSQLFNLSLIKNRRGALLRTPSVFNQKFFYTAGLKAAKCFINTREKFDNCCHFCQLKDFFYFFICSCKFQL